jgi:hypothetical protein
MLRRLGREDLASVNPFLKEKDSHAPFLWHVYEDYEVVEEEDALPYLRASTPKGYESPKIVNSYNPLIDTPRLFLDFARIAERKNPANALSQWIAQYGLLGFAHGSPQWSPQASPEVVVPPQQYDDRGGPGETLDAIWYEVYTTNGILALYEAVLNRDPDKLESLLFPSGEDPEWLERRRQYVNEYESKLKQETASDQIDRIDVLVSEALRQVWEHTGTVSVFAYPIINPTGDLLQQPLLTVDRLKASWRVRNLLGAMYLQFFWLVTSAGELSRCKYCGRIISYAPPIPAGEDRKARKPRKDKEFCDSRCRQNYHYHNRIKLERSSEQR